MLAVISLPRFKAMVMKKPKTKQLKYIKRINPIINVINKIITNKHFSRKISLTMISRPMILTLTQSCI